MIPNVVLCTTYSLWIRETARAIMECMAENSNLRMSVSDLVMALEMDREDVLAGLQWLCDNDLLYVYEGEIDE